MYKAYMHDESKSTGVRVDLEIQEALRVYLDVSPEGIYPTGGLDRLRRRYGAHAERLYAALSAFLDPLTTVPDEWGRVGFQRAGDLASERARSLHPDLPAELCTAIGHFVAWLVWHG